MTNPGIVGPLSVAAAARYDLPTYLTRSTLTHPTTWDPGTQTYNITPAAFANWRLALSKSIAGVSKAYLYSDGDSLASGAQLTTPETQSYTAKARSLMSASGRWGTVVEPGPITLDNIDGSFGTTDSRLTRAGTVTVGSGLGAWGTAGSSGWGGNNGTWSITFGPVTCDTFEVYDQLQGLGASAGWFWAVDGGSTTFVVQNATGGDASGMRKTSISAGSVGSHTLTLTAPTAGNYGIVHGITYKTAAATSGVVWAKRGVGGSLAGLSGATAFSWNNTKSVDLCYTGDGTHTHPVPNLVVLELGTNFEANAASFLTNMTALITSIKSGGADVLLCVAPPGGGAVSASQAAYLAAIAPLCYQLADTFNIGLFDLFWRWGGVSTSTIDAYFQQSGGGFSSGHPNTAGHADWGLGLYNALAKAA